MSNSLAQYKQSGIEANVAIVIDELTSRGITFGSAVQFELPTRTRLDFVAGRWQYRTLATTQYTGEVVAIHPNQVTVYVASEDKNCKVHPEMCKPV